MASLAALSAANVQKHPRAARSRGVTDARSRYPISIAVAGDHTVNKPPAPGLARLERFFLPPPTPDDLILAIQDRIVEIEAAIHQGDEEDTELLSHDLESLHRLCEVVTATKSIQHGESGTTINEVVVAGAQVGSINSHCFLALHKPKRRGRK